MTHNWRHEYKPQGQIRDLYTDVRAIPATDGEDRTIDFLGLNDCVELFQLWMHRA